MAVLLETVGFDRVQQEKVLERFKADRDEAYREFIDKCADFEAEIAKEPRPSTSPTRVGENDVDLEKLKGWLAKIRKLDFYQAPLSAEADTAFNTARRCWKPTPIHVFEAHEENRTSAPPRVDAKAKR